MANVFIVSAPSGSGKSTLLRRLLAQVSGLVFSISYTTRDPRGKERDGEDYNFVAREAFEAMMARDEFLESADVFGNYYGTHQRFLHQAEAEGADLLLDIDVQGARQLRQRIPDAVSIFILPPSRKILEERLRARGEDAEETIQKRLRGAAKEIRNCGKYDYLLVNQDLEESAATLCGIIRAERSLNKRMKDRIQPILATFEAE